ncbi:hypothetical protein ONE63_001392 [Megalurothrips usitatus]|uniref:Uncharacterized protein n=1 Tax=Megalurothrips usitatus TaxID=439358 RepID=A0AAV7XGD2_9NEOP|nr:hypothetical protein ONE63_001392 [Megalurothrips usitatus]
MAEDENIAVSSDENCSTTNLQVFVCSVCGDDHETENCAVVQGLKSVQDSKILSRARQTLPKNLDVTTLADGSTTVITNVKIEQGTQFGPFQAPLSLDLPPSVSFPLKVFGKTLNEGYYLDTTDEESCNWMCLVAPATTTKEQNLICYDVKQTIFFTTTREVQPGEELRLWYALYYGLKLQALPLADDSTPEVGVYDFVKDEERLKIDNGAPVVLGEDLLQTLAQHLPAHALGASGERDLWICKLCGQEETNVAHYARHLMIHYRQPTNDNQHPISIKLQQSNTSQEKRKAKLGVNELSEMPGDKGQAEGEDVAEHSVSTTNRIILSSNEDTVGVEKTNDSKHQNSKEIFKDKIEESGDKNCVADDDFDFSQSAPLNSNGKQIEGSVNVDSFQLCESLKSKDDELSPQLHDDNREQLVIHSSTGETFSTSFDFSGAQDIDMALENGESITFIMVDSSNGNVSVPAADGDNIVNATSTSQLTPDSCPPVITDDVSSEMPSSEKRNKNAVDGKTLPFNCDICHKSFGKCSYLYRHLRKHTGEFTCVTCLAVFARKENLQTHSCLQPKEWFSCQTCGKKFSAKKYLQRHAPMHTGEFTCSECKRRFVSHLSLKFHRCTNNKPVNGISFINCFLCDRVFGSESKLKAHLKLHSDVNSDPANSSPSSTLVNKCQNVQKSDKKKEEEGCGDQSEVEDSDTKVFICEVCGAIFKSYSSLKQHRFRHGEKQFQCETCKKRFYRKDVLQEHLKVHEAANYPCNLCGKKYKTKKSLHVHSLIHKGQKRFSCSVCGKEFFQKGNLGKHMQTHAAEKMYTCKYCNKSFSSKEYFNIHELTHTQGKIYHCKGCKKSFVKKHLLETHHLLFHSNRGFLCKYCNTVIRHRHSVRRHLEKIHSEHRQEWSLPGFIDFLLVDLPENVLQPVGDTKLTPLQQQERQQQLELLRKNHFHRKCLTNAGKDRSFYLKT